VCDCVAPERDKVQPALAQTFPSWDEVRPRGQGRAAMGHGERPSGAMLTRWRKTAAVANLRHPAPSVCSASKTRFRPRPDPVMAPVTRPALRRIAGPPSGSRFRSESPLHSPPGLMVFGPRWNRIDKANLPFAVETTNAQAPVGSVVRVPQAFQHNHQIQPRLGGEIARTESLWPHVRLSSPMTGRRRLLAPAFFLRLRRRPRPSPGGVQ